MLSIVAQQLASSGGPVLVALFLLSVASLTVAIFKIVQFRRMKVGSMSGTEAALAAWVNGDFDEAISQANADGSPASVAVAGAMSWIINRPEERGRARDIAANIALRQLNTLNRNLRFLETVAQAAPMLGLLGTVIGMISAFGELSAKAGAIDPSALAGGIWVALITTAAGLTVAIPVYFLSMWFESRVDNERSFMEAAIAEVLLSVHAVDTAAGIESEPAQEEAVALHAVPGGQ